MDNKDSHSSKNLHNVQSTLPSRGSQEAPGKLESQSGQQLARAERVRQRSVSGGNALRANNDNTLRPLVPFLETSSSSAIPDTGEGPNRMQPTKDLKESPGPYCVPKDQALITDYAPYLTQGWAEVLIRRPTGNTSWMMRLQNFPSPFVDDLAPLPLHDLSTALLHINQDSGLNSDRPAGKGVPVRDVAPCGRGRPTSAVPQGAAIAESKADHFSPFVQDLEEAAAFVGPQASVPAAFFPAMEFCSENTSPEPPHLSPRDSLADLSRSSSTSLHGGEQFVQPEEGGMCTESPRPVPSRDRSQEDDEEEDEEQRLLQQQGRVHGLNKSSSSPELSTLRELTKEWEEGAEWPVHKANVPTSISCNPPPSSSELPLPLSREESQANGNQSNSMYRPRGHTISESTTSWRRSVPGYQTQRGANDKVPGGASPSFVFLQLFYSPFFANETNKPILLPKSQVIERAVKVLDRMPPYDTHKIGVIYVGEGQAHSEAAILANEWGSPRYAYFIQALGRLVRLQDCDPEHVFLGGLDTGGEDGRFACCSHDDIMQMMFHVATLMPNKETDKNCSNKKRHICNSYVTVVYNDSHDEYKLGTLTGQFNFVEIIIKPLDYESNLVTIQARKELEGLIDTSVVKIVSDRNLSLLVRQMALHANMASLVHMHRDHHHEEYAFKWLARLRQVKRIRGKVLEELQTRRGQVKPTSSTSPVETGQRTRLISTMDDFSGFV
uniref:Tuberin n=1 Tax=Eptatretus burgeri TaxID=7764 RepID=A0A8C4WWL8_EPTBU